MIKEESAHVIALAIGSGLAPIRALLHHRVQRARDFTTTYPNIPHNVGKISLFAGHRIEDTAIVAEIIGEAITLNLFDILSLTPSNPDKKRAQDCVFEFGVPQRLVRKIKGGAFVFVCGSSDAAEVFRGNLDGMVGCDVRKALGNRYIEEIY